MKIFHLSTARTWRGGEQQIAYLATELQPYTELQQWVVCVQKSALAAYCQQHQIPHLTYTKISPFNLFFAYRLKQWCQQYQIDLIHLHDPHAHNFAILSARLFQNKTFFILSRRVDFSIRNNWYSNYKYNHPSIKRIICVSKAIEAMIQPSIKDKDKLTTIYSGVAINRFTTYPSSSHTLQMEYGLPADMPLVGNVAALADHKDYFTFVDTAKLLVEQGIRAHFFIIGEGKKRSEIETYIKEQQLQKHITLTGFRKDIPQLLPQLTVFLMTSKTEGLGTAILDAYACEVAVVATKAGGIPELIIDGETGLLAPIQEARKLANKVGLLLEDVSLRTKLVKQAKKRLRLFTTKRVAALTMEEYKKVLGS